MKNMENENLEVATFAGGCFWCIESAFAHLDGVIKTVSGLTGGAEPNPSYESVHQHDSGHVEAVRIWYNPEKISYKKLLEIFWMQIDPTDNGGQFADRGPVYRTVIFYHNEVQQNLAEQSKNELDQSGKYDKPIVTQIKPAQDFFEAEDYHQGFYKKNPRRYQLYRIGSGRAGYIEDTWGKNPLELSDTAVTESDPS